MFDKLLKLANLLDKTGHQLIADEVDAIAKNAMPLTDEQIDENVEKYFNDPDIQERNLIEKEYGLDEDDMFGLEHTPFNGFKWNYEGFPKEHAADFKPLERYQTVIGENEDPEESFTGDGGTWELEGMYPTAAGATKGTFQAVYRFVPEKEIAKRNQPQDPDILRILNAPDDEVEAIELPDDAIEVIEEEPKSRGGVNLF